MKSVVEIRKNIMIAQHLFYKHSQGHIKRFHPGLPSMLAAAVIVAVSSKQVLAVPVTTTITDSGTISLPTVHKGDTINIEATLRTNDVNENGEGEPLIIKSSSSGFSATISKYAQPRAFSFPATVDGESLLVNIDGYDGDESATVTVDVNQKKRFTQEQKDKFANASAKLNTQAGVYSAIAVACLLVPDPSITKICSFGFGATSVGTWILSAKLNELALDPVDPNFTQIAVPITPPFTPLVVEPGITQGEADSFNALLTNQTQAIGLVNAIITSINRAQGASEAGNTVWENKQMAAASKYALELNKLLDAQNALRANVKNALLAAGFPTITISPNDALNFEINVLYNGLPPSIVQNLTNFGADAATIEQIRELAYVQDLNEIAGSFPTDLTNAELDAALADASEALLNFALDNAVPLSPGQEVKGQGTLSKSDGSQVDVKFEAKAKQKGSSASTIEGSFSLKDCASGFEIKNSQVTRAVMLDDLVVVDGTYQTKDGRSGTFRIIATVDSTQGKGLTVSVSLSNGYRVTGSLKGKIEIKK